MPAAFIIYHNFSHIGINIMRAVYNNEIMEYFKLDYYKWAIKDKCTKIICFVYAAEKFRQITKIS